MRELAILTFTTLDGVMQSPTSPEEDPSEFFAGGGWALDYWEEVMAQVMQEAMAAPYDLLLGRKTYEIFANHFSKLGDDNPEASKLNVARKYVVSSALSAPAWKNTTILTGDIATEIGRLKQQDGPLLQVHGSWQLIQALLAHELVDEFRLWTFPVVLGGGKRLFADGTPPAKLRVKKSAPCGNGVVMNIYRHDD